MRMCVGVGVGVRVFVWSECVWGGVCACVCVCVCVCVLGRLNTAGQPMPAPTQKMVMSDRSNRPKLACRRNN